MPKQPPPADRAVASQAILEWDEKGKITALKVPVAVNYGTFGRDEEMDLLNKANGSQRMVLQEIADKILRAVKKEYLE